MSITYNDKEIELANLYIGKIVKLDDMTNEVLGVFDLWVGGEDGESHQTVNLAVERPE